VWGGPLARQKIWYPTYVMTPVRSKASFGWRALFPFVLLFACVDGFLSNWLYPAKLPLLYRDLAVLVLYLLFLIQEPVGMWVRQVRACFGGMAWSLAMVFMGIGLLQIFNPALPSVLIGVLGFKVTCYYWPLTVVAFAYSDSVPTIRTLLRRIGLATIFINLFGLYQFANGPDFLLEHFGPGFERALVVAGFEGATSFEDSYLRVIGTFASSGQYGMFLDVMVMLVFALFLTARTPRERGLWLVAQILNFMAILATGSRGALLYAACTLLVLRFFGGGRRYMVRIGVVVALGLYIGFHWMGGSVIKRFETLHNLDLINVRTFQTTPVMFGELLQEAPFGLGMGMGSTASRHLVEEDSSTVRLVENHLSKIQLEMGIVGVLCFYLFVIVLGRRWMDRWRLMIDRSALDLINPLSAYCLTALGMSWIIGGFDSPPASFFFWVLVGIVARATVLTRPTMEAAP